MTDRDHTKDLFQQYVEFDLRAQKENKLVPDNMLLGFFQLHLMTLIESGAKVERIKLHVADSMKSTRQMKKIFDQLEVTPPNTEEAWKLFTRLKPTEQAATACTLLNITPEMLTEMLL